MRKNESDKPIPYSPVVNRADFLAKYVGPRGAILYTPHLRERFRLYADRRTLRLETRAS